MFSAEYRRLVYATVAAMSATSVVWLAAHLSGLDLAVHGRGGGASTPTLLPWGAVLFATALGGVAACVLVRIAARATRPRRTFAVAVTAGLALSSFPPVQAAVTHNTAVVLLLMHAVAALVIVPTAAGLLPPIQLSSIPEPSGTPR